MGQSSTSLSDRDIAIAVGFAQLGDGVPDNTPAGPLLEAFKRAIEAYEAARWQSIEEAPYQKKVLTLWQSGEQEVMYRTEYCPPLVSTWRYWNGTQGPWPVMFRDLDPPPKAQTP